MTPVSIGLTLLGLIALFWPIATVLCKRNVLNAQWLMMLAMFMLSLTFILLGCLFNTFLQREYLLLMLFLDVIIVTPPVIHIALTVLTHRQASLSVRAFFLPSLICIALMIASSIIGGADMYRLWAARGLQGLSGAFFPNSWRYNLIVAANFYLFWTVFTFETLFILISGIRQAFHLKRINSEYYSAERYHNLNLRGIYIAANLGLLIFILSQFTKPFEPDNTLFFYLLYVLPLAIILLYIGRSVYRINNGAERIPRHSRSRRDPVAIARQIEQYVEKEKAYLNPDLSVFLLAEHLHTSEDDIIDAIHFSQGIPFADYIDALRVQHTISILLAQHPDIKNPDTLSQLAHSSGFLSSDALEKAWQRVTHAPLSQSHFIE